jgi:L-ribulose-5-phosphate 4-epimerase
MHPVEGVIKYREDYSAGPALPREQVAELAVWRRVLFDVGLIGQDPARYDGASYGNASTRTRPFDKPKGKRAFIVTGTQTGRIPELTPDHFTIVEGYDLAGNSVTARGPIRASSESMTHGAVYDNGPLIRWIFHAHSPEIWHARDRLKLPSTRAEVQYGTPEMAWEVHRLFAESDLRDVRAFAMAGHEDGVITFGASAAEAAGHMVDLLARARLMAWGGSRR